MSTLTGFKESKSCKKERNFILSIGFEGGFDGSHSLDDSAAGIGTDDFARTSIELSC
jgi:hypothetical protein